MATGTRIGAAILLGLLLCSTGPGPAWAQEGDAEQPASQQPQSQQQTSEQQPSEQSQSEQQSSQQQPSEQSQSEQQSSEEQPAPCSAPEARQFDFWVGDWDLTWGKDGKGTNTVRSILDGCVIEENFASISSGDFRGKSVSMYNPRLGKWQQTWVDNAGGYLDFVGGFADGKMTLSRRAEKDGRPGIQRMVFYNITPDSMDWDWELSADEGRTWDLKWRIHYQRRK